MLRKICLNTLVRVNRKRGFWHILETTLILKATHEVNLDFRFDLKSTLISKNSFSTLLGQPWFKGISWSQPLFQGWFQNWSQVNLDFKIQFLYSFKSRLISKATQKSTWFQKTTFIFYKWITSQCLTREFWRGCEYYHLEWFSFHAISVAERAIFLTGWRFHTFASLLIITPEFPNITCEIKSLHLQACFMISYNRIGIKLWWMIFILLISHTLKLSVDDVELSFWRDEDVTFHIS